VGGGRRKILFDRKGLLVHLFSAINHDNMARAIAHVRSRLDVLRVPCENFQRIDAARMALRLCNGTMSVRLSVSPMDRSNSVPRVSAVGPSGRRYRSTAAAAGRRSSTAAFSSKCEQCHVVS